MKGATWPEAGDDPVHLISIHAPVKGATHADHIRALPVPISIHAPVKGATRSTGEIIILDEISIHAPVKGATRRGHLLCGPDAHFNPRSREGSDATPEPTPSAPSTFQSTLP